MKVTRRERNLLAFLLLIGTIALVFVFVITPLQSSIDTQKSLNTSLTDQKVLIDAQLLAGTGLSAKVQKALDDVNLEFTKIEAPISSEEFELRLQPILVINEIGIISWIVNDPIITTPNLPTYENSGYVYKLKELVDNYNGKGAPTSIIPISNSELVMTTVIFTFSSSYIDYIEVLDAIVGWNSTVFVSSTSRDNTTGAAVIAIDFYSIEKP
ncbi:MAG: hypothetical protein FD179_1614 [Erysipelotrichaceae bacterium]|nr:MAG: hypothetical protein FD179_1614 [Erysipelotrichaceae bacterium]